MKKTLTILFCFVALTIFAQQKTTSKLTCNEDSVRSLRNVNRFVYTSDEGKTVEEGDAFADSIIVWILNEAVNSNNVVFYDYSGGDKISKEEAKARLKTEFFIFQENPDKLGTFRTITDTVPVTYKDVIALDYNESVVFDKTKPEIKKTVNMFGPVIKTFDKGGNVRGKKTLFMIKLN